MDIVVRSEQRCFGGVQGFYSHASDSTATRMNFAVYQPPQVASGPVPALYYLAGLTCNEETFVIKAGAQRLAAELGLLLVACDTSPRGLNLPGDAQDWDFGVGAGFYLDAEQQPWAVHYRMGRYVNEELPAVVERHFPVTRRRGIFGHSMGGHGALVTALRHHERWHSLSAFAPISNPSVVPWGRKAFASYLGADESRWAEWDATQLLHRGPWPGEILIDQGGDDQFLSRELKPEKLERAAASVGQSLTLRRQAGYDHSYYFIQSFMEDHLRHHAQALQA